MALSASALRGVFNRSGGAAAQTYLVDETSTDIPAFVETAIGSDVNDAVLLSWQSEGDWFVLTPDHLIISHKKAVRRVPVPEIARVTPVKTDTATNRPLLKNEMSWFRVALRCGEVLTFRVDPGRSFIGVWNVLTSIEAANRAEAAG